MCVCVVCVCVCVCVCVYIYIYVCMYIYIKFSSKPVAKCLTLSKTYGQNVYVYICTYICMYIIHMYIYVYICIYFGKIANKKMHRKSHTSGGPFILTDGYRTIIPPPRHFITLPTPGSQSFVRKGRGGERGGGGGCICRGCSCRGRVAHRCFVGPARQRMGGGGVGEGWGG